jgi:hypothetical protein
MANPEGIVNALERLAIADGGIAPAIVARPGTPRPPTAAELFADEEMSGMKTPTNQRTKPVNTNAPERRQLAFLFEVSRRLAFGDLE